MSLNLLIAFAFLPAGLSLAQGANDSFPIADSLTPNPFFAYNKGFFSIGSTFGIHPNYIRPETAQYYFVEAEHSFQVKGLPIHLQGRFSNEEYRTGNASYFRMGYEPAQFNRERLKSIQEKIKLNKKQLSGTQDSIQVLEGKLSYLRLKQMELQGMGALPTVPGLPVADSLSLPDTPRLDSFPGLPADLPSLPDAGLSADSLQSKAKLLEDLLQLQKLRQLKLEEQSLDLQQQYDKLADRKNLGFLDGIRKFDVGLSTLSPGSLSKNRVPMQGIHVAGTVRKWFYDAAAGMTLPNQLFSNQAFDQLVSNSGNLFNMGEFFAVSSTRFVSSAVVGYGEQEKNSIAIENFYTGRSLNEIREKTAGLQQVASNLSVYYTPKRLPNLTWNGTVGTSLSNQADSLPSNDNLAIGSGINWKLSKQRGLFTAKYRRLGAGYSGWSQGIFLQGATHYESSYRRTLGKTISVQLRGARDEFAADATTGLRKQTTQGGTELQWKCLPYTSLIAGYTLLQLTGATTEPTAFWSHLGKLGLYNDEQHEKCLVSKSLDGAYALIAGPDSTQRLVQSTGHVSATFKKWRYGMKMQYMELQGISRLSGSNLVLSPEIGVKGKIIELDLVYQQLFSQQFGNKPGLQVNFLFRFNEILILTYTCQQWLPTDYTFFLPVDAAPDTKPVFMRWKLTLYLNQKR